MAEEKHGTPQPQEATIEAMMAEEREERRKQLSRRKLPATRTLAAALAAMTRAELDDIRYNLNVKGTSALKKAALVERLVPEVLAFSERWLPSALDEEYALFRHLLEKGGISTELREDDLRLDYLRGLGLIACGTDAEGKLAWYLPDEVRAKLRGLDSGTYRSTVALNTEAARLAAGLLFYYGYLNYDQLHARVLSYLEPAQREQLPFFDFLGVMLNASCWQAELVALPHGVKYYLLDDEARLVEETDRRSDLDYAELSYSQVYDAGAPHYIEATPAYQALAQFFMKECHLGVLQAAEETAAVYELIQNDVEMGTIVEMLQQDGKLEGVAQLQRLMPLLGAFNNTSRLWLLKGHTPDELAQSRAATGGRIMSFAEAQAHRAKVGRNDPCPCGSGKKYKNCCMKKDEV